MASRESTNGTNASADHVDPGFQYRSCEPGGGGQQHGRLDPAGHSEVPGYLSELGPGHDLLLGEMIDPQPVPASHPARRTRWTMPIPGPAPQTAISMVTVAQPRYRMPAGLVCALTTAAAPRIRTVAASPAHDRSGELPSSERELDTRV
jgi:hypothetical protein